MTETSPYVVHLARLRALAGIVSPSDGTRRFSECAYLREEIHEQSVTVVDRQSVLNGLQHAVVRYCKHAFHSSVSIHCP